MSGSWPRPGTSEWTRWWSGWVPRERATLMLVRRDGALLLIEKKRGLGAGKVNAPGGRVEPGESEADAAVRETMEEVGVRPLAPEYRGRLRFQFTDGFSIEAAIFVSGSAEGGAVETAEARPFWTPIEAIPYERMWADDPLWLPKVLAGETVDGRFVFDGDQMLAYEVQTVPAVQGGRTAPA
ncbi:MAG: 8-oxo-dGTP diphosphatase [Kiritimatiellae bacterium]|nr:8-oxo-dGTP diphosphatase [Kiritimatiellia bacterium]